MLTPNEYHIALTGHRPQKLAGFDLANPYYQRLHDRLLQEIINTINGYPDSTIWCHSGMALGADTVWGFAILNAKKLSPKRVKLHAEIPMMTQPDTWFNQGDRTNWQTLYSASDAITVYNQVYASQTMQKRNIGMINHANKLIALWDGSASGTKNAIDYAIKQHKQITYIKPDEI